MYGDDEPSILDAHQLAAVERWREVMAAAEADRHYPREYLIQLAEEGLLPRFAAHYAIGRISGAIAPAGRPALPPFDPRYPETFGYQVDERQREAVDEVRRVHAEYSAFRSLKRPAGNGIPYRLKGGLWIIPDAKNEARRVVADRLGVSPLTLARWERRANKLEAAIELRRSRFRAYLCQLDDPPSRAWMCTIEPRANGDDLPAPCITDISPA